MTQLNLQARHAFIGNSAGNDEAEVVKVRIHIQGKSMVRDPTTDAGSIAPVFGQLINQTPGAPSSRPPSRPYSAKVSSMTASSV